MTDKADLIKFMESKSDYFRSPVPINIEDFNSPFGTSRPQQDPQIMNNFLSPFNRNSNSSFSLYSPTCLDRAHPEHNQAIFPRQKLINKIISFGDQGSQESAMQIEQTPDIKPSSLEERCMPTTSRKKYELRSIDPNERSHLGKDLEKGLRALSKQAFDAFKDSASMTYQEVADKIINQSEDLSADPNRLKEKQSIKRRVYDALNVLIAVGTLQKKGKKINLNVKNVYNREGKADKAKKVKSQLEQKLRKVIQKRKIIQHVKKQKSNLSRLINRNASNGLFNDKISFPFIVGNNFIEGFDPKIKKLLNPICADIDTLKHISSVGAD